MSKIFKGSCDIAVQLASQIQANSGASCTLENMTALSPGGKGIEQMNAECGVRNAEFQIPSGKRSGFFTPNSALNRSSGFSSVRW
jgi:hypothetical protein